MQQPCSHCGAPLRPNAKFCARCGQPAPAALLSAHLPGSVHCAACGHPNRPGANFCAACRAPLTAPLPVARVQPQLPQSRSRYPLTLLAGVAALFLVGAVSLAALLVWLSGQNSPTASQPTYTPTQSARVDLPPAGGTSPPVSATSAPVASSTPVVTAPPVGWQEGNQAPDFELRDLDGNIVRLSDLRGQVVVLNFWATWCPYCREELNDLESFHGDYKDKEVIVLAINQKESADQVRKFRNERGLTFRILLDPDGRVGQRYHASGLPHTCFIDRFGVIRSLLLGRHGKQKMIDSTEPLL